MGQFNYIHDHPVIQNYIHEEPLSKHSLNILPYMDANNSVGGNNYGCDSV